MITELEPPRSIGDANVPVELRAALAAGRADVPTAEALARMAERLGLASNPASEATSASAATSPLSNWSKRALLPCVALLCAIGGWYARDALLPAPNVAAPPPALPPAFAVPVTPAPTIERQSAPPVAAPAKVALPRASAPLLPARAAEVANRKQKSTVPEDVLDPNAELALLGRAQAQLVPAPRRALALAEEHARRYPRGVFQEERELIAIVSLLNSGDLRGALARVERFEHAFPSSVHQARLQSLLGDHKKAAVGAPSGESAASRRTGEN
jgi:hypothetical protein